jgi:hypothetical protein
VRLAFAIATLVAAAPSPRPPPAVRVAPPSSPAPSSAAPAEPAPAAPAGPPPGATASAGAAAPVPSPYAALEPGLELALVPGPSTDQGDGLIAVVRIDPARFRIQLLNASAPGEGRPRSVRDWAFRAGASAAINASLYQEDWRTAVGLMRGRGHVNHARVGKDRAALAFDPIEPGLPPVRIIDRDCEDLETAGRGYAGLVQSIRMVSCMRQGVWAPSERRFSSAAVGVDGSGHLLFIHASSPWPVHLLVAALLAAPIDLRQAMYVEGGPEAQLYVRGGGTELSRKGATDLGFTFSVGAVPVPNVLAAVRRGP